MLCFLMKFNFMDTGKTLKNVEIILNNGIDVVCAGLDQDSRGKNISSNNNLDCLG